MFVAHWLYHSSMSMFLANWGTQNWTQYSGCSVTAEQKWRIISLHLLTVLFLGHPRRLLAFFVVWVHYWLMFTLLFTWTPRSFSERKERKDNIVTSSVLPVAFLVLHTWLRAIRLFLDSLRGSWNQICSSYCFTAKLNNGDNKCYHSWKSSEKKLKYSLLLKAIPFLAVWVLAHCF